MLNLFFFQVKVKQDGIANFFTVKTAKILITEELILFEEEEK